MDRAHLPARTSAPLIWALLLAALASGCVSQQVKKVGSTQAQYAQAEVPPEAHLLEERQRQGFLRCQERGQEGGGVGGIEGGGGFGFVPNREVGDLGAAFLGTGFFALVGDVVFEGAEEVGAEAGLAWLEGGEGIAGEKPGEEVVGEVAGCVIGAAFFAEEGDDGCVVGLAEIAEGLA